METIWHRIETWLSVSAPSVLQSLLPGATEEEIVNFEARIGRPLPEDVAHSYRIHNGQREGRGIPDRFVYGDQLYPLSKALRRCDGLKDLPNELETGGLLLPQGAIEPRWSGALRVPIASDDSTHYYFLDYAPAHGGSVGQVILSYHDDPRIVCVATGFRAWLEVFASQLEGGQYVFSARRNGLIHIDRAND